MNNFRKNQWQKKQVNPYEDNNRNSTRITADSRDVMSMNNNSKDCIKCNSISMIPKCDELCLVEYDFVTDQKNVYFNCLNFNLFKRTNGNVSRQNNSRLRNSRNQKRDEKSSFQNIDILCTPKFLEKIE